MFLCTNYSCTIALSKAKFPPAMNCPVCQKPLVEEAAISPISEEDQALIDALPYIIAYPLKQSLLEEHAWTRINLLKDAFLNYLKYIGLITASEFFNSPFKDKNIVALFQKNLGQPSFGSWNAFIRETINYLKSNKHKFFCQELVDYYEKVEAGKKRKLYRGEIEVIDAIGDVQIKKQEETAIGMLINFRNRYLGHGLTLNQEKSEALWEEYFPIFHFLLENLEFPKEYPIVKTEGNDAWLMQGTQLLHVELPRVSSDKVWMKNMAGDIFQLVPFFILPGEVAINKDDKVEIFSYESYHGKSIKFFSPEGIEKSTTGRILDRLKLLLKDKQQELIYAPEEFTETLFQEQIRNENKFVLATLLAERKVISGIYQHREEMENKLREWVGSSANIFFIAAEAGSGKTNLLVEIQRQYEERNYPTLLIRAERMVKDSIREEIAYLLNLDPTLPLNKYTVLAQVQDAPTFVLVDGLNEAKEADKLWKEMVEMSTEFKPGALKFVITNRTNSVFDLQQYTLSYEQCSLMFTDKKEKITQLEEAVFWLPPMNMVETEGAWNEYIQKNKKTHKPLFSFDDIVGYNRVIYQQIRNPLTLRLFLSTYHGKPIPKKRKKQIYIWRDWLNTFNKEEQFFLSLLAKEVWKNNSNELLLHNLLNNAELSPFLLSEQINSPYQKLIHTGWISRYNKHLNTYIGFTAEGMLYYLLAMKLKVSTVTNVAIIDKYLASDSKIKISAVEAYLKELAFENGIAQLIDLIDHSEKGWQSCVMPILHYLKNNSVQETIAELIKTPSAQDWKLLEVLREKLKENQLHHELETFDKYILQCPDTKIQLQEFLKVTCLESIPANERVQRIQQIIEQKTFERYSDADKYKFIVLIIEQLSEIESALAIQLYQTYFEDEAYTLELYTEAKLHEYIGNAYYSTFNQPTAEKIFRKGLTLITKEKGRDFEYQKLEFTNSIACCKLQLKEYEASETLFKEVIENTLKLLGAKTSFFILIYSNYAELLNKLNRFKEAKKILHKCLVLGEEVVSKYSDPMHNINNSLGWNNIAMGEYEKAAHRFHKCLTIAEHSKGSKSSHYEGDNNNLGVAYLQMDDLENAKKYLEAAKKAAEKMSYEDSNLLGNFGVLYFKEENYEKAIEVYKRSLEILPDNTSTLRNLGDCYAKIKKTEEALQCYFKIEELLKGHDYARLNLADTYHVIEKLYYDEEELEKALEFSLVKIDLYKKLGFGDADENLHHFYSRIAYYYSELENNDEAIKYYEICLKIALAQEDNPDYLEKCYFDLADEYQRAKRYEKAIENFKIGFEISGKEGFANTTNPKFAFNIALCFEALGNLEEAFNNYLLSAEIRKETEGISQGSLKESINNSLRLAEYLKKKDCLPSWLLSIYKSKYA